jgi:hypothetical protein
VSQVPTIIDGANDHHPHVPEARIVLGRGGVLQLVDEAPGNGTQLAQHHAQRVRSVRLQLRPEDDKQRECQASSSSSSSSSLSSSSCRHHLFFIIIIIIISWLMKPQAMVPNCRKTTPSESGACVCSSDLWERRNSSRAIYLLYHILYHQTIIIIIIIMTIKFHHRRHHLPTCKRRAA